MRSRAGLLRLHRCIHVLVIRHLHKTRHIQSTSGLAQPPCSTQPYVESHTPLDVQIHSVLIRVSPMWAKVQTSELDSRDFVIVVLGPVGSGKSAFIAKATGSLYEDTGQEFCAGSHTRSIQATKCAIGKSSNVVLVDTPGFGDKNMSEIQILAMVSKWLHETYDRKATAILCFHPITDNRMRWSPSNKLAVLQELCEDTSVSKIVLVTTMWDEVDEDIGNERLAEFRENYWKTMILQGARTFRYWNTPESARELLQAVTDEVTIIPVPGSANGTRGLAMPDSTPSHDFERNDPTRWQRCVVVLAILFTSVLGLRFLNK